jgi:hypothetical protein
LSLVRGLKDTCRNSLAAVAAGGFFWFAFAGLTNMKIIEDAEGLLEFIRANVKKPVHLSAHRLISANVH